MQDFVRRHTTPAPVPLVPGIVLHTATDVTRLWETTGHPDPPFWAFPWAGGQALARHLLDHPHTTAGKRVLDLASGSGLVAIAAATTGAAHVTANDIDPLAGAAITLNAHANHVTVHVDITDLLDTDPDVDVVLAGDVFYDRAMAARVLPFLRRAHTAGAQVLVGDPHRAHLPRDHFEQIGTYRVPVPVDLEGTDLRTTLVWRPATPPTDRP
ncbi:putative nicotinamide N-methyase [Saccharothrix tamanrassetensis]|uniref:Putative nicotinamide N-methyase n=1 Tax=Saccharothrix tamanrassetensis TaxID=1051531 RepID=A0A841CBA4_9PSEU|nr:50S ribosomal protein L11 methyltransferase [Saccharothrix tamanrassetensis]MBB5953458.1 putative nicotinamide N-methyase [Saccharothrix tamanrassetensis]